MSISDDVFLDVDVYARLVRFQHSFPVGRRIELLQLVHCGFRMLPMTITLVCELIVDRS